MNILRVIISWRFNFFAETLIKHLPPAPTWLFHVGKNEEQIKNFRSQGWIKNTVVIRDNMSHGDVLDRILINKMWPDMFCNNAKVLFLDHDFVFMNKPGFNLAIGKRLVSGMVAGYAMSAIKSTWNDPNRLFMTVPGFAVDPEVSWPCSWRTQWDRNMDTGQAIALHPDMRGRLDVFDWHMPEFLHWTSTYTLRHKTTHSFMDEHWMRMHFANYCKLVKTGIWEIHQEDIETVMEYPMLANAFGIKTPYDREAV